MSRYPQEGLDSFNVLTKFSLYKVTTRLLFTVLSPLQYFVSIKPILALSYLIYMFVFRAKILLGMCSFGSHKKRWGNCIYMNHMVL